MLSPSEAKNNIDWLKSAAVMLNRAGDNACCVIGANSSNEGLAVNVIFPDDWPHEMCVLILKYALDHMETSPEPTSHMMTLEDERNPRGANQN